MSDNHWDASLTKPNRMANLLLLAPAFQVDEYCRRMCPFHYHGPLFIFIIQLEHAPAWSHLNAYQNAAPNMIQWQVLCEKV